MAHHILHKCLAFISMLMLMRQSLADFSCLCNYSPETPIYNGELAGSTKIGYMYEFDCKEIVNISSQDGWTPIAYAHMLSYVHSSHSQVMFQMCRGDPPNEDVLFTSTRGLAKATTIDMRSSDPIENTSQMPSSKSSSSTSTPSEGTSDSAEYTVVSNTIDVSSSTKQPSTESSQNKTHIQSTDSSHNTTLIHQTNSSTDLHLTSTSKPYTTEQNKFHTSTYNKTTSTILPIYLSANYTGNKESTSGGISNNNSSERTTMEYVTREVQTTSSNTAQRHSTESNISNTQLMTTSSINIKPNASRSTSDLTYNNTTASVSISPNTGLQNTSPIRINFTGTSNLYSLLYSITPQNATPTVSSTNTESTFLNHSASFKSTHSPFEFSNFTTQISSTDTKLYTTKTFTGISNTADHMHTNISGTSSMSSTHSTDLSSPTFNTLPSNVTFSTANGTDNSNTATTHNAYNFTITTYVPISTDRSNTNISYQTNYPTIKRYNVTKDVPVTDSTSLSNVTVSTTQANNTFPAKYTSGKNTYLINTTLSTIIYTNGLSTSYPNTAKTMSTNVMIHTNTTHMQNVTSQTNYTSSSPSSSNITLSKYSTYPYNVTKYNTTMRTTVSSTKPTYTLTSTLSASTQTTYITKYTTRTSSSPPSSPEITTASVIQQSTEHGGASSSTNVKTNNTMYTHPSTHPSTSTVTVFSTTSMLSGRTDICPYNILAKTNYTKGIGYIYMRQYGQYCYELRPFRTDWIKAYQDCKSRDGDMVVVSSSAIQQVVHDLLKKTLPGDKSIWLGLQDIRKSGQWAWSNGEKFTPLSYSNWMSRDVDSVYSRRQVCVTMDAKTGLWATTLCSPFLLDDQKHPWVCQYKII